MCLICACMYVATQLQLYCVLYLIRHIQYCMGNSKNCELLVSLPYSNQACTGLNNQSNKSYITLAIDTVDELLSKKSKVFSVLFTALKRSLLSIAIPSYFLNSKFVFKPGTCLVS